MSFKKSYVVDEIERDRRVNERLKKQSEQAKIHFDKELFEQGTKWSLDNNLLQDAEENKRNNHSFIEGYQRGERLKYIEQLNTPKKTR